MKNYYEILEVDKNASDEIIKAAYKSLVKKYHPDLKEGTEKKIAEEKIKEINDAYDVLSDPIKREEYNLDMIDTNISQQQYESIISENIALKKELSYYKNTYTRNTYTQSKNGYSNRTTQTKNNAYQNNTNQQRNRYTAYTKNNYTNPQNQQYNNYSNQSFFKSVLYKLFELLKPFIAIGITALAIFIVFSLPFFKDLLSSTVGNGYFFIVIIIILYIYFFANHH